MGRKSRYFSRLRDICAGGPFRLFFRKPHHQQCVLGYFHTKKGPIFANAKGNPANLNNTWNREILPVLNRCVICRKPKECHVAASHEYVRDGSLPRWDRLHSFRRGHASRLYALGVDDVMVQQILRHQDVGVTRKL